MTNCVIRTKVLVDCIYLRIRKPLHNYMKLYALYISQIHTRIIDIGKGLGFNPCSEFSIIYPEYEKHFEEHVLTLVAFWNSVQRLSIKIIWGSYLQ